MGSRIPGDYPTSTKKLLANVKKNYESAARLNA